MKWIKFFLCAMLIHGYAMASEFDAESIIKEKLPLLEQRISAINPELIKSSQQYPELQRIIIYNNWLAEHLFQEKKKEALAALEQESKKTGRAIHSVDDGYYRWLDRGVLENPECQGVEYPGEDAVKKGKQANKYIQDVADHTCFYPDGFEEYSVLIDEDNDTTSSYLDGMHRNDSILILKDDKKSNTHTEDYFDLIYMSNDETTFGKYFLHFSNVHHSQNYTDFHNYRNAQVQSLKDGTYQFDNKTNLKKAGIGVERDKGSYAIGLAQFLPPDLMPDAPTDKITVDGYSDTFFYQSSKK